MTFLDPRSARRALPALSRIGRLAEGAAARGAAVLRAAFDGGYRPDDRPSGDPAVGFELDGVSAGHGAELAVEGLTGGFGAGTLTAVLGPNGAGKSTLLDVLAGVLPPRAGRVRLVGDGAAAGLGYLPQASAIARDYPITALEFAALGRWRGFGAFRTPPYALLTEVIAALRAVGMQDRAEARIGALSVGQFRRVLFARLIVQRPRLILLDEPFAAVDARTTSDLLAVLGAWHEEGRTVIAVLHDLDQAREHFPAAMLLARRVVAWGETEAVLSPENLARAGMASPRGEARAGLLRLVPS